jgi:7-keto-8-aminopelargonate synthetase-like enzyme
MSLFISCIAVTPAATSATFASDATTDWKNEANARIVRLHQREVPVRLVNEKGILIPAIRCPTVAKGTSRLRIMVTSEHERANIDRLLDVL